MSQLRTTLFPALAWMLALLAFPASAAEVNKYLPDDSGAVITVNVRQVLDSALVKQYALDLIKGGLTSQPEVQKVLDALGVDPFKDLDQVVIAAPDLNENTEKGLVVVSGRFDAAKVKTKAAEIAKNQADQLKIHKAGANEIYELKVPDQPQPIFAALVDQTTLVASPAKDYIIDALDKGAGKKKTALKNKEFTALLEKVDGKQGLWIAVGGNALNRLPAGIDDNVKDFVKKLDALAGGLTVAKDVQLQFVLNAKDVQGAKDLHSVIDEGLKQGIGVLALLAQNQKELAPLIDVVKSIKITNKDKAIIITGEVTAEVIEKAMKNIGQ